MAKMNKAPSPSSGSSSSTGSSGGKDKLKKVTWVEQKACGVKREESCQKQSKTRATCDKCGVTRGSHVIAMN